MYQIKQSSNAYPLVFFMADSADHISGKTGLSPTVTIRKTGGSFVTPSGSVSEIGNGFYQVAGNATDTNTLGPLLLHATADGADPTDTVFEIVAFDPQDAVRQGLSALPNANAGANNGLPVLDSDLRISADLFAITGSSDKADALAEAINTDDNTLDVTVINPNMLKFPSGCVYLSSDGDATTSDYPAGEATSPVKSEDGSPRLSTAVVIAKANKLNTIKITNNSGFVVYGSSDWELDRMHLIGVISNSIGDLGGSYYPSFGNRYNSRGLHLENLQLNDSTPPSGIAVWPLIENCIFGNHFSIAGGLIRNSKFCNQDLNIAGYGGSFPFLRIENSKFCSTSSINYLSVTGSNTTDIYNCSGKLTIKYVANAGIVINVYGFDGEIEILSDCTAGTINIKGGSGKFTNSGSCTVNIDGFFEEASSDVNVISIDGDSDAATNLKLEYNGTGYKSSKAFAGGIVHCNYESSYSGTTYPAGEATHPVNNLPDAVGILTANKLKMILLNLAGDDRYITQPLSGYKLIGTESTRKHKLIFNYQQDNVTLQNVYFRFNSEDFKQSLAIDCSISERVDPRGSTFIRCQFDSTAEVRPYMNWTDRLINCFFENGSILDMANVTSNAVVDVAECQGSLTVKNLTLSTATVNVHAFRGKITIDSSCTSGTINLYGKPDNLVNNGSCTVNIYEVSSGLTQQEVRDAMKLAPSSGDPESGSIDKHLDDIQAKTDYLPDNTSSEFDQIDAGLTEIMTNLSNIGLIMNDLQDATDFIKAMDKYAIEFDFTTYSKAVMLFYDQDRPFSGDPDYWCYLYTAAGGNPSNTAEIAKRDRVKAWAEEQPV